MLFVVKVGFNIVSSGFVLAFLVVPSGVVGFEFIGLPLFFVLGF